jgi:hypothetical protein
MNGYREVIAQQDAHILRQMGRIKELKSDEYTARIALRTWQWISAFALLSGLVVGWIAHGRG